MNFLVSVGLFMKRRSSIFFLLVAAVFTTLFCGCVKERNCSCVYSEGSDQSEMIVNVDRGIKCEKITSMGTETLEGGDWSVSTIKVSCREVSTKKLSGSPLATTHAVVK